ncbi:unnamed protein product [Effrenium voratum]|uniref:Pseudouridine synthase RsuA/RluA-like domain-containing protein n=1 Tax=Effrenium voratum TaxID=2562239 RepID=A0AA36JIL1_9DINO|nr:unnamed protein product [Effrenium voratum]
MAASPGEVWTLALDLARAIPAPSEISCCTVLTKLQSAACWLAAMDMLQGMPLLRIQPDMISCSSAASVYERADQWQSTVHLLQRHLPGDQVMLGCCARAAGTGGRWRQALHMSTPSHSLLVRTAVLGACSEASVWRSAYLLLSDGRKDVVACNVGLKALRSHWPLALASFQHMASARIPGDETSAVSVMQSQPWPEAVKVLREVSAILRPGVVSLTSALSTMSAKDGWQAWQQALSLASGETTAALRTAASAAVAWRWRRGWGLLRDLRLRDLRPDAQMHGVALAASSWWPVSLGYLAWMKQAAALPDTGCYNVLLNSGCRWQQVLQFLQETPQPDQLSLNAAMSVCDFDTSVGHELLAKYGISAAWSSSSLWAMARLTVQEPGVIHDALAQVASSATSASDLPKLAWASTMLGVSGVNASLVVPLQAFRMEELQLLAWGSEAFDHNILASVQEEVTTRIRGMGDMDVLDARCRSWIEDVLGVLWACSYAACLSQRFREGAWKLAVQAGLRQDSSEGWSRFGAQRGQLAAPWIAADLGDRLVVAKPPHWEVHDGGTSRQLLSWLLALGFRPLAASCDCGFLHRLDVPSSGLVLVARSYSAYFDLQVQLRTGELLRDYLVLCRGWPRSRRVTARLFWRDAGLTRAGGQGKPSETHLETLVLAWKDGALALLQVRVITGRRHQIRSHSAHIGHPTVRDGKYTSRATFQRDTVLCPRNFLHRWSLTFSDAEGAEQKVTWPLPADLRATLTSLPAEWKRSRMFGLMKNQEGINPVVAAVSLVGDRAGDPKLATWMLSKLAGAGLPSAAAELLRVLRSRLLQPNVFHFSSALCSDRASSPDGLLCVWGFMVGLLYKMHAAKLMCC